MGILNNPNIKFIGVTLLSFLLTGCYTDFEPDLKSEPVLCLNSVITAGEPVEVEVSRTWRYSDVDGEENHSVDDAVITVCVNGEEVGEDYIPIPGDKVRINAVSRRYGSAEAEVTIPPVTSVSNVATDIRMSRVGLNRYVDPTSPDTLITEVGFSFNLSVDLTVKDPGPGRHFFMTGINPVYDGKPFVSSHDTYFSLGSLNYDLEPIFTEHMTAIEAVSGYSGGVAAFFSDRMFENGDYRLKLRYEHLYLQVVSKLPVEEADRADDEVIDALGFGVNIEIQTISDSYYNWVNYLWQSNEGMIGDLGNIGLGTVVSGYSNVSTGAGIVMARTFAPTTVSLREVLVDYYRRAQEK